MMNTNLLLLAGARPVIALSYDPVGEPFHLGWVLPNDPAGMRISHRDACLWLRDNLPEGVVVADVSMQPGPGLAKAARVVDGAAPPP